jgi:iron(III) transport system permease protein
MPAALLYLGVVIFLSLGVPCWSLAFWMITGASTGLAIDRVVATTVSSIELALIGGLITTLLALPVAWISVRHAGMVTSVIERATYIGHAMPGIVIALSLVAVSIQAWRPLYQTYPLLITAYVISFLPLATVSIRAALMQAPPALDEAARALGAGPITTLRRVTVPLIAGGLGTSTLLVFLAVVTELTATLLLAPIGTETLATRFWSHADSVAYGAAAPYAVLMVLLSAPATYLLTRETVRGHRE